jgi:HAD superfamily hydrolase (TIGR01549 family)
MLKAVIFDVDDTLIDWSGNTTLWMDAERPHLERVFAHINTQHPLSSVDMYIHEYTMRVQRAWANARSNLVAPHLGRILVDTAIALGVPDDVLDPHACMEAYEWDVVDGTRVFPDVIGFLQYLRDHGIRTAIITNSFHPAELRDRELAALGLLEFFPECRITAADVGYLKPHPDIFSHTLACLGVSEDEVVFIGDNPVADIAGAQGFGLRAVLRVKSPAPAMLSGLIVPDAAVNSFVELKPIFDEWFPGWDARVTADAANP